MSNSKHTTYSSVYLTISSTPHLPALSSTTPPQDPVPAEPFVGVFEATAESKACQRDIFTARYCGQEDCLHLNIYTKQLHSDAARNKRPPPADRPAVPVMVFFHGGAYMFGCNNKELYNPEFLLRKDVVVVTVNYRLGAFGFLSVDDPAAAAPGNAGLKDQVMALRWIREHIGRFGGDAERVTIFGESAGGCSVHYHLVSPMSRGLFSRAIAMSGAVLTSWSVCPLLQLPERLARAVGWDGSGGSAEMMRVLRTARADRLLRAQERLADRIEKRQYMMFTFGPKVEPYRAEQCFIDADPVQMCRRPWSRTVPVIFTACSNEGLLVHKATQKNVKLIENLEERFQDMVPLDLMAGGVLADRDGREAATVAAAFRRFYFGDAKMTLSVLDRFEQMMSDKLFLHGIYRAIQLRLAAAAAVTQETDASETEAAAAPTWYMRFDVDSKQLNLTKFMFAGRDSKGACHADDCHFLFKTCIHPSLAEGSPEFVAIDRFVSIRRGFNLWVLYRLIRFCFYSGELVDGVRSHRKSERRANAPAGAVGPGAAGRTGALPESVERPHLRGDA